MTIHDFDMARYVTGSEVVEVYAPRRGARRPAIGEVGDVDTAVVMLAHENGCLTAIDNSARPSTATTSASRCSARPGMAASREPARPHGGRPRPPTARARRRCRTSSSSATSRATCASGTRSSPRSRAGATPPVGAADARAPLVIGLAAWRSVRERRPVRSRRWRVTDCSPTCASTARSSIVTGGTQGLGAAIAAPRRALGAAGVVDDGRNRDAASACARDGRARDRRRLRRPPTSPRGGLPRDRRRREKRYGRLDGLVNSAGLSSRGTLDDTTVELWDRLFAVNVRAPFVLTQEAARLMRRAAAAAASSTSSRWPATAASPC